MQQYQDFEYFIADIEELLKTIEEEQKNTSQKIEQYHKVNMKKFAKLTEFHEICDMTNQVFERRISNMEQKLSELARKMK